jgi:uncharacterized membrane protein
MDNPVIAEVERQDKSSAVAIKGHPIHAMAVAFPIALVVSTLAADVFYWWSADSFWTRAALWTSGGAFWMGLVAAATGTLELLLVRGIRNRPASWSHAVAAMMLLAVAGFNWGLRLYGAEEAVMPLGLFLSALSTIFVGLAGWHGGKLVFDYGIGMSISTKS